MTTELGDFIARYAEGTRYIDGLVAKVGADDLDRKPPAAWSPRQIIHHLADSELQSYARLRRLIAEPAGSIIQGYDEGAWAENPTLGYGELPIANSVAVFLAVRSASLDVIERLTPDDLGRSGEHSESGPYTVRRWLEIYTQHPFDHGAQLERALEGLP